MCVTMDMSRISSGVLDVLAGRIPARTPIWLMRQAGRYLPEYREVRAKAGSFLDLCLNSKLASEVTLQPVRRFGFDAAILFSDILIVPLALGQKVEFLPGEGPKLEALRDGAGLAVLRESVDENILAPIYEAARRARDALDHKTALIGFCGAPWTVATYMVAGVATSDQAPARLFAYRNPEIFEQLIDRLVESSIDYLVGQLRAGAEVVQIFDTWSGVLGPEQFERWCIAPMQKIVAGVRQEFPGAKIIGFPRGAGAMALPYVEMTAVSAIGIDWAFERSIARDALQPRVPVQGNVDPMALLAGGAALDHEVDDVMKELGDGPLIFNLGHGILPETPIANVERMLKRVRG